MFLILAFLGPSNSLKELGDISTFIYQGVECENMSIHQV